MKKNVCFVIFTFVLILCLLGLGSWQLQRKTEKEALITKLEQGMKKPPLNVDKVTSLPQLQPLTATGRFLANKTIVLTAKTFQGKTGCYILNAFQTQGGNVLLVQRGWSATPHALPPLDVITIEGIGRISSPPTYFQPNNTPPTYFWIDLQLMSKELNLHLLPYYVIANTSSDPHLLPTPPLPSLSNNHLQYAITWYSLAFCLIGMLWYGRKKFFKKD